MRLRDVRYVVLLECNDDPWEHEFRVEAAVPRGDQAEQFAKALLDQVIRAGDSATTHRGRVLTPCKAPGHYEHKLDLRRVALDPVTRDEVIIDHRTFELFDMNTLGFVAQAKAMAKLGFSGRKGVLLYGPPGMRHRGSFLGDRLALLHSVDTIRFLIRGVCFVSAI